MGAPNPANADDDADTLAARVLAEEHHIYPLAVRLIAEGRTHIENDKVTVREGNHADKALINPRISPRPE